MTAAARCDREFMKFGSSAERADLCAFQGGVCYSTCTMFLGLPQTCIAPNTVFGFHGPSSYGKPLEPAVFDHASKLILEHYPLPLKQWYWDTARHELRLLYKLKGAELIRIGVQPC